MTWSPFEIDIILHHHCSLAPHERKDAPIYPETVEMLCRLNVLTEDTRRVDGIEPQWMTTPLGAALVEMWCSQPLPVPKFVDPRFEDTRP